MCLSVVLNEFLHEVTGLVSTRQRLESNPSKFWRTVAQSAQCRTLRQVDSSTLQGSGGTGAFGTGTEGWERVRTQTPQGSRSKVHGH